MPIHKVVKNGKTYYKWGKHGKLYTSKKKAQEQAAAAYANGYKGEGKKK